jgi:hypothetical protein
MLEENHEKGYADRVADDLHEALDPRREQVHDNAHPQHVAALDRIAHREEDRPHVAVTAELFRPAHGAVENVARKNLREHYHGDKDEQNDKEEFFNVVVQPFKSFHVNSSSTFYAVPPG